MILKHFCILLLLLFLLPTQVWAFPDMVRHGYTNCMTCHISPTGGGVLSSYGRSLSKELVSTWSINKEDRFMYFAELPDSVAAGGDFRYLDYKRETQTRTDHLYIFMQRDLEVAVTYKKLTFDMSAGTYDPRLKNENMFISRRHFVSAQLTDEWTLRAGKFYPAFGIYIPDHNTTIRSGLVWDQNMESYNLESAYQTEKWGLFITGILGRPDDETLHRESGGAISFAYNLGDTSKIGVSYYYGGSPLITHHYFGPYAILGFTKNLSLLSQITEARTFPYSATEARFGWVDYQKLDYEFYRGLHAFLTQEFSQLDDQSNLTRQDVFGIGLQFFPRPHLDLEIYFQKAYAQGLSGSPSNITGLYAHFYP